MTDPLRLVVFDVDGTLVDSQADILGAMAKAFHAHGQPVPPRGAILELVGLSLDVMMRTLAPNVDASAQAQIVQSYKDAYMTQRQVSGTAVSSPLYEGALECLQRLNAIPNVLLGVATGKSKRGLDKLIDGHALEGMFVTQQVADFHPSKPHPAMLHTAMSEAGVEAADAIISRHLRAAFPDVTLVTEEQADSHGLSADQFLIVDPLDGTKEFIKRRGDFTVNIAYVVDGVPVRVIIEPAGEGIITAYPKY